LPIYGDITYKYALLGGNGKILKLKTTAKIKR
jgi:hypothetical protein